MVVIDFGMHLVIITTALQLIIIIISCNTVCILYLLILATMTLSVKII